MCETMASDLIYHRLRVTQEQSEEAPKTHILYNGVSANSWLSPSGITKARSHSYSQPSTPSPLPETCRNTLRERAKSANAMLGRRHFEIPRQGISQDETLNGTRMVTKSDQWCDVRGQSSTQTRPKTTGDNRHRRFPAANTSRSQRPHTSVGECRSRLIVSAKARHSKGYGEDLEELPHLTITQMLSVNKESEPDEMTRKARVTTPRYSLGTMEDESHSDVTNTTDESLGFQSVTAMRETYDVRVKSANMLNPRFVPSRRYDVERNMRTNLTCYSLKTKDNKYQNERHITPRNRFEESVSKVCRGGMNVGMKRFVASGLKPLFYSSHVSDEDIQDTGCTSGCKGCFRACLASEDYFTKVNENAETERRERIKKQARVKESYSRFSPRKLRIVNREMPEVIRYTSVDMDADISSSNVKK